MSQLQDPRLLVILSLVFVISGLFTLRLNKNRRLHRIQRGQLLAHQDRELSLATFAFPKNNSTAKSYPKKITNISALRNQEDFVEDSPAPIQEDKLETEQLQGAEEAEQTQQQHPPQTTQRLPIPAVSWRNSITLPPRTRTSLTSSVMAAAGRWGSFSDDAASCTDSGSASLPGSLPGSVPKDTFFMGIGAQFGRTPSL
ncbi:hypothetical protein QBC35DRAFT_451715 [Podospora australis]|uniref:Uncharacterized protein n=1 Tax=Podospora australis TaxID=1536484 RepID=A0AAN6WVB7_9PEZI|nr:hypothetical protein QBC35DRAFT_451715 [Podospora australis]